MRALLPLSCIALAGCSALIEPDERRLGGEDAEPIRLMDSGPRDAQSGDDAGTPLDADRADTGTECVPGCMGDVLVSCDGGMPNVTDCRSAGAFCQDGGCTPWVCMPGAVTCTEDGTGVATCNERGSEVTTEPCAGRCDPGTGACVDGTTCAGLAPIGVGEAHSFDLCEGADDETFTPAGDCDGMLRANSGDATFVLTLTDTTTIAIELTDADLTAAIDTVVYLRRACDDPASQVACDDDVPCSESTIPTIGCSSFEVRQSRIVTTLGPGTYYIVADAFVYATSNSSYRCGRVRLAVSAR